MKWELWIHVTFPTPSNKAEIRKAARSFKFTVSIIKEIFNSNFRHPILSLYTNFFLTYSEGTDTFPGVPFCIAVRGHTRFISLSFLLIIVSLLSQGYLYLTPVPIWLTDANLSPLNNTVNFDCFMKLIKTVISSPIDHIKYVFSAEPIIFDRWRWHSSFLWLLVCFGGYYILFYTY